MVQLLELKEGEVARVVDMTAELFVRERLLEMGLAPGREVRVVHRMPLSGPLVVQAGTTFIALREIEASTIWVKMI